MGLTVIDGRSTQLEAAHRLRVDEALPPDDATGPPGRSATARRDAVSPVEHKAESTAGTVLLVDSGPPEPGALLALQLRAGGYKTVQAGSNAHHVVALLSEEAYDVLLIDIRASECSVFGFDLARSLRTSLSETELPVLFLATAGIDDVRARALAAGANDFICLPMEPTELLLRVRNLAALSRLHRAHQRIERALEREVAVPRAKLETLIESGLMISMERDRSKLLRHLLTEGQRLLNCGCGTMYLVTEEKSLRFALRTKEDDLPSLQIPLHDPISGRPNESYVSVHVALRNRSVLIDDVYQETRFDLTGTRKFDAASGYRTVSMLTVPMAPRGGEVIGVLQFINAIDAETGAIVPFPAEQVSLVEALAAQAAVALDNLNLVESQKRLIESIIRVIATAIDAKSPYTGRHCERVPELAFMLAAAACESSEGSLAGFAFKNEDEWQEFRIGAWLHDCGKVTTPEYVIDKATKLEMIYNRIHEVRMRFEVLLRDLEIGRLEALLQGKAADEVRSHYEERRAALFDDFAFVADCNVGVEAMDASRLDRLKRIGQTRWMRHFDDRLGLSLIEAERLRSEPPSALPAAEFLLADRPRDIVPRAPEQVPDAGFGFKVDVPVNLYDYGELYNLGITHGTVKATRAVWSPTSFRCHRGSWRSPTFSKRSLPRTDPTRRPRSCRKRWQSSIRCKSGVISTPNCSTCS